MEPLQLNRELLRIFYVRAIPNETSRQIRLCCDMAVAIILIQLVYGLWASADFIIKSIETDLAKALYCVYQLSGEFSAGCTVLVMYLYPESIHLLFTKFQHIRENGTNKNCKFYIKMIKRISNFHFYFASYRSGKVIWQTFSPDWWALPQNYHSNDKRIYNFIHIVDDCTIYCKHHVLLLSWRSHQSSMSISSILLYVSKRTNFYDQFNENITINLTLRLLNISKVQ